MSIHETFKGPADLIAALNAPKIVAVVAMGKNRELGKDGKLLWHIPDDLKRFKALTMGHPVIMGRKTFESIVSMLGTPLPGRTNIVVTRDPAWSFEGVTVATTIDEALESARALNPREIHVGGGAHVYEQMLTYIDRLHLTLIDDAKDGDSFFPPYEQTFTKKLSDEAREWNGLAYRWVDLER